jgi:hypothetical protein
MNIQTVTVEIHEKRNHPHEYGHYDARVAYTAQVEEGESAENVASRLQELARTQVEAECDRWIEGIELEVKKESARQDLCWIIGRAESGCPNPEDGKDFDESIALLSEAEQEEYQGKLEAAKRRYVSYVKSRLEAKLSDAAKGKLTQRGREAFCTMLEDLPEAEREEYRARMEAATAPIVEAAPQDDFEDDLAF